MTDFVVPFERLSDLLGVLTSKDPQVLSNGLLLLRKQLAATGKTKEQIHASRAVLGSYLKHHSDLQHFRTLWENTHPVADRSLFIIVCHVLNLILRSIKISFEEESASAMEFCRWFIDNHLRSIYAMLSSSRPGENESALHLLITIVSFGGYVARDLINAFDFSHKSLSLLLGRKSSGGAKRLPKKDLRSLAISFVSELFHSDELFVKQKILDMPELVRMCYERISTDAPETILKLLQMLRDRIILDSRISRPAKCALFSYKYGIAEALVSVYDLEGDPEYQEAVQYLHSSLVLFFTRPGECLCFRDNGWFTNTADRGGFANVASGRILKILRPCESLLMQDLAERILVAAPELQKVYWKESKIGLDLILLPQLEVIPLKWQLSVSFALRLISLPLPDYGAGAVDLDALLQAVAPEAISHQYLTRSIQHELTFVRLMTICLLIKMFKRFELVVSWCRTKISTEDSEELLVRFQRRVPEYSVISGCISTLISDANCSIKAFQFIMEQLIDLVNCYHRTLLHTLGEVRFDAVKFLIDCRARISAQIFLRLLPLFVYCYDVRILEKRDARSVLWHLLRCNFLFDHISPEYVEGVGAICKKNSVFSEDRFVLALLQSVSQENFDEDCTILERLLGEVFKAKGSLTLDQLLLKSDYSLGRRFASNIDSMPAFNFFKLFSSSESFGIVHRCEVDRLLNNPSIEYLDFLALSCLKDEALRKFLGEPVINSEAVAESLQRNKEDFLPLVAELSPDANSLVEKGFLRSCLEAINSQSPLPPGLCFLSRLFLTESRVLDWAQEFGLERVIKSIVVPCDYFPSASVAEKYFLFTLSHNQESISRNSVRFIAQIENGLSLCHEIVRRQSPDDLRLLLLFIKNSVLAFSFFYKNFKACGKFAKELERYFLSIFPSTQSKKTPTTSFKLLNDEEKVDLVSKYSGTCSDADQELLRVIRWNEERGSFFGDFLTYFGGDARLLFRSFFNNSPKAESLAANQLALIDARKMKGAVDKFPLCIENDGSIYDFNFVFAWLSNLLLRIGETVLSDAFWVSFIQSHSLSLLIVALGSENHDTRCLASSSIALIFKNVSEQSSVLSFAYNALWCLRNCIVLTANGSPCQLPLITVHFFAKSFPFLVQPSHSLFARANRFFLRSGLPSFDRFPFLSDVVFSADRLERIWLLEVLRDCIRDENSLAIFRKQAIFQFLMNGCLDDTLPIDKYLKGLHVAVLISSVSVATYDLVVYNGVLSWLCYALRTCFETRLSSSIQSLALALFSQIECNQMLREKNWLLIQQQLVLCFVEAIRFASVETTCELFQSLVRMRVSSLLILAPSVFSALQSRTSSYAKTNPSALSKLARAFVVFCCGNLDEEAITRCSSIFRHI